jgi:hypothetical protein
LRARGDLTVDIEWKGGRLLAANLRSNKARKLHVRHMGRSIDLNLIGGRQMQLAADLSTKT